MPGTQFNMMYLCKSVFLAENILLLYIFLTPVKTRIFQAAVFIITWVAANTLRYILLKFSIDPFLISYIVGFFYIVPCVLIFRETAQAKIFVFFMIYSITQFTFLVFMHIDRFLSPAVPHIYVLTGMLIELASLPLFYRYARQPVRSLLEIINVQDPVFTLFPLLSFLLLAVYGLLDTYRLSTFIMLVLTTTLIFFSYYMAASSITGIKRLAVPITDNLTGLYNRQYMEDLIEKEYQKFSRTGSVFALASADINFFKNISTLYGRTASDSMLKNIAGVILESIRTNDTVVRWSEKEFFILFRDTDEQQALEISEMIRKKVEGGRYIPADNSVLITLTLGVSVIRPSDTVDSLIKRADISLYPRKQRALNCVVPLNPESLISSE